MGAAPGEGDGGGFCPGCGRPSTACGGCGGASDPWHYCPACGRWLAVQVTPTGWSATCRGCGTVHRGANR